MKIHTRVVIQMDTGAVLEDKNFEYDGPVAECKGSSSSTTVDEDYNDRMATLAEEQQDWAREYFEMWQEYGKPYEEAQYSANLSLLPYETSLYQSQLESASSLLGTETDVASEYLNQSLEGLDVNEQMGLASADAAAAWADTEATNRRENARIGVNPNSGRYQGIQTASDTEKAASLAQARTQARVDTENTNYERLQNAVNAGVTNSILSGINYTSS